MARRFYLDESLEAALDNIVAALGGVLALPAAVLIVAAVCYGVIILRRRVSGGSAAPATSRASARARPPESRADHLSRRRIRG